MRALIARQLKAAMKRRRLNQSELATRSGISRPAISLILQGEREPRASTLCALADTLNVSADWLLGRRSG